MASSVNENEHDVRSVVLFIVICSFAFHLRGKKRTTGIPVFIHCKCTSKFFFCEVYCIFYTGDTSKNGTHLLK